MLALASPLQGPPTFFTSCSTQPRGDCPFSPLSQKDVWKDLLAFSLSTYLIEKPTFNHWPRPLRLPRSPAIHFRTHKGWSVTRLPTSPMLPPFPPSSPNLLQKNVPRHICSLSPNPSSAFEPTQAVSGHPALPAVTHRIHYVLWCTLGVDGLWTKRENRSVRLQNKHP